METEWDTAIARHEMFSPNWSRLSKGDTISVVINGLVFTEEVVIGQSLPDNQPIRLYGDIDAQVRGCKCLTVLGAVVDFKPPFVDLLLTDLSMTLAHGLKPAADLFKTVEFCAGLGATGVGLAAAGFDLACSVEWRSPLAAVYETVHPTVPVIVGDITELECLKQVAALVDSPFCLTAGISCQPYSIGGAQGGSTDERSSTLPATIRACYLFQCPLLILECVPPVRTNRYARSLLLALERESGYHLTEVTLRLEDTWASRRFRWWLVATHPSLGKVSIPDWPQAPGLVVRDLMPVIPSWSDEVIEELRLKPHETSMFTLDGSHMRKYVLQLDQKMPTCLHSWGSPADPCPCTCRAEPFSEALIKSRGIYAVVVPIPSTTGEPQYRHLHPAELAVLNGLVPPDVWTSSHHPSLRLCLCGVGQLASPLQALWVGACVRTQLLHRLGLPAPTLTPTGALQQMKQQLYEAAKAMFLSAPTVAPTIPDPEDADVVLLSPSEVVLLYADTTQVRVQVSPEATVAQLRQADDALQGVDDGKWIDAVTCCALSGDDTVSGRTIRVCASPSSEPMSEPAIDPNELEREVPLVPVGPLVVTPASTSSPADAIEPASQSAIKRHCTVDVRLPSDTLHGFLDLSGEQLAALIPPLVVTTEHCSALRQATTTSTMRLQILQNQGAAMADDELHLHVLSCVQLTGRLDLAFLDPLLATGWLRCGTVDQVKTWMHSVPHATSIVSVVLLDGHWIPIMWSRGLSEVRVTMWEHDDVSIEPLFPLHGLISQAWERPMFSLACYRRSFARDHCGAASVCFLGHVLLNKPLPVHAEDLLRIHEELRSSFGAALGLLTDVPKPWGWGLGVPDVVGLVSNLLQLHGVPHAQCQLRAKMLIQSLGKTEVQSAVTGITPWKSLKILANAHKPVIQLVLPDEQAQYAASKQASAPQAKKQPGGTKRLTPARPAELDPAKLVIDHGAFCVDCDEPLMQTPFNALGPLSVGVALATFQDAKPFLDAGSLLSSGGLAMLIINPPADFATSLQWSSLRFAARCAYNQEPMLLSGALVQLGRKTVYQYKAKNVPAIMSVEVATVYFDQWEQNWEDFASKPVKHVLACIPCLQTCRVPSCQCPGWHPSPTDQHDALLDVFRRQFFGENGRPTKWDKADYFAVLIRYVKCLEPAVLTLSGRCGLFIEPKTEDAMQPHGDYQVIWLPSLDFATVSHKAKIEAHCLGIARSGRRYGLRVKAQHFQEVFASVKPEAVFLAPRSRMTYHTGPWPYGCDRKSIARALKAAGWKARPLQPLQNVPGGLVWSVQAVCEPPTNVLAMQHGQVVLTRHDTKPAPAELPPNVVGQEATVRMCSTMPTTETDPWLTHDPWKKAIAAAPQPPVPAPTANALQELEDRVERSILAKLPQQNEGMEVDDQDQRIAQLEMQLHQLAGRQTQLEATVSDNHAQQSAQVHNLQQQMLVQMDHQSKQMQTMLTDQMSRAFFLAFLFMQTCRIGEARKPGPNTDPTWSIGICNPSGLQGKYQLVSGVDANILAISESHLTKRSMHNFDLSLRAMHSRFTRVITGAPLAPRSHSSDAGGYAGVAFTSTFPCRTVAVPWPADAYESSRVQIGSFFSPAGWVTGSVVYGYPAGKTHVDAKAKTEQLLDFVVNHLNAVPGPRFFAGDWNFEIHELALVPLLRAAGWVEVQDLLHSRTGAPVQLTCKAATRKDYLWLSPELALGFMDLQLDFETFADHAVLVAQSLNPLALWTFKPQLTPLPNMLLCGLPVKLLPKLHLPATGSPVCVAVANKPSQGEL
ncbi:unnamed protein product [Cladocopium goreaui]|uniref:Type II methyltransferase M.NaeI (M.NaeI) (Cytosine-specific methyltransferase NaeI) (Modification methylase NaeI) n=1 Tax=Cladocopium goreaui TaxID=2562237 RepID=A0A9P1GQI4_9DINO|nr:unnamed protein product [Cladocopium goreaui]